MKSNIDYNEIFKALDRYILFMSIISTVVLVIIYFTVPHIKFLEGQAGGFIQSLITEFLPIPFLFILSYTAYRRIRVLRSQADEERLAMLVAEKVNIKLDGQLGVTFLDNFPSTIDTDIESSKDLWLVGVALSTPVKKYYSIIERKLHEGHRVKVITINPHSKAVDYAGMRAYGPYFDHQTVSEIQNSLINFCTLKKIAPENLSIRVIDHPLGNGMVASDIDMQSGVIYISNYPFKTKDGSLPKFVLRPWHGKWFELYKQELQNLWSSAVEWNCDPDCKTNSV